MANPYTNKPEPFFELIIHDLSRRIGFTAADTGYECAEWRYSQLTDYLFDWLIEFAMKYSELEDVNSATAARMLKRAAKTVYATDKYKKRGEFGELLLHALVREVFGSEPAISKIYYKSGANDTVKGFDAVHIIESGAELELWLGEVKFYKDFKQAVSDVVDELKKHTQIDYLRDEFLLISGKIDTKWPHAEKLRTLIGERKSLDTVFRKICIPVLITYQSDTVFKHNCDCEQFRAELKKEVESLYEWFNKQDLPEIKIHLFLVPIADKEKLISSLHAKLEGLQR